MRIRALVAVVGLMLTGFVVNAVAATQVKSVRLWRAPDNTRLVFDLTGPVQHSVFTLTSPDRLVIDINGATASAPLSVAPGDSPVTSVRSAQRTPNDLRVVVDLKKAVTPKSFTLAPNQQYGNRLVVDLFDSAADAEPAPPQPVVATTPAVPVTPTRPAIKLTPVPSGKRDIVIAIDAGHGGEDPGASGPRGQHEKDVVLQIAKELQRQINAEQGFRAELTRTGDYFILSVFALSERGATSETARWLADTENRSDLIGGAGNVSLDDKDRMLAGVLLDLSMTASLTSSLNVGQKVLSNIGQVTPLHKRRVEQAGFMVLKSPDIPSILVETGFISNSNEANKLQSSGHQQALARSIRTGVKQFFQQNPPPGTYMAWLRDTGKIARGPSTHVVRPGETLAMLAARYDLGIATLRSANDLKTDELKIGQEVTIPSTALASQ
ncbi:N-acetylmuramoyl-L-alanine amidase [Pseudomonas putida]|nr:N-acetylmuramoyl-L-alanine amidase [Pseudomonas putida]